MSVLVLGSGGFLGSALVTELRKRNVSVTPAYFESGPQPRLNLTQPKALVDFFARHHFDVVVNAAGMVPGRPDFDRALLREVNTLGPSNLGRALALSRQRTRLVHVCSASELHVTQRVSIGEHYLASKAAGSANIENAITGSRVSLELVYVYNTYGPGQPKGRFVAAVLEAAFARSGFEVIHPDVERDFIYVQDAVEALADVVERGPYGDRVEIGTGRATSLRSMATNVYRRASAPLSDLTFGSVDSPVVHPPEVAGVSGLPVLAGTTSLDAGIDVMVSSERSFRARVTAGH